MTPQEISIRADQLRQDLLNLSRQELGMGNYKRMMHDYQLLVLHLINVVDELADEVVKLSPPHPTSPESTE